jgi:hypothetical protein
MASLPKTPAKGTQVWEQVEASTGGFFWHNTVTGAQTNLETILEMYYLFVLLFHLKRYLDCQAPLSGILQRAHHPNNLAIK